MDPQLIHLGRPHLFLRSCAVDIEKLWYSPHLGGWVVAVLTFPFLDEQGDDFARAVVQAWATSYPGARDKPFQILIPDSRSAVLQIASAKENKALVCGGIDISYAASCSSVPGYLMPRGDFKDIFELLHAQVCCFHRINQC